MDLRAPRDERADILRKAAEWRSASPEERDQALCAVCATAARILATRPDRERVLAYVDPLPEDSRRILEVLKAERARRSR